MENAFRILRFRRRDVVTFRRFVVLSGPPVETANDVDPEVVATQPVCVMMR
jgi:hypothetical protein